jgi:peroxiredoxin
MELEALQGIYSEVKDLGAQIVVLTPELERYTRALHKKLNLTFDILTDLHLKDRGAVSPSVCLAGLFARALQVCW